MVIHAGHISAAGSSQRWFACVCTFLLAAVSSILPSQVGVASEEDASRDEFAWGEARQGLQCRVIPLRADSDEHNPSVAQRIATAAFARDTDVALLVQIKNVSDQPLTLLNVRHNERRTPPAPGHSHSNDDAPLLFRCEVIDDQGQEVRQVAPVFERQQFYLLLSDIQTPVLRPGETLETLIRPGQWQYGQQLRLRRGRYRIRVSYQGVPEGLRENAPEVWKDKEWLHSWSGNVHSAWTDLQIQKGREEGESILAWGKEHEGLRAAFRLLPSQSTIAFGRQYQVRFFLQNTSDQPVTFWSETWRQEDRAELKLPDGSTKQLSGVWYSGLPIMMHWTLDPGDIAELPAADLGVTHDSQKRDDFEHPVGKVIVGEVGDYRLRFEIRLGSIQSRDKDGKLLFPTEADWVGELKTNWMPLKIEELQPNP